MSMPEKIMGLFHIIPPNTHLLIKRTHTDIRRQITSVVLRDICIEIYMYIIIKKYFEQQQ